MKFNIHPSCSCSMCRRGKRTGYGHYVQHQATKQARREWRLAERDMRAGGMDPEDYAIQAVFTPFTD